MDIITFDRRYIKEVITLWNQSCAAEMPYQPFTRESFTSVFLENPDFDEEGTFIALEGGRVVGFSNGIFRRKLLPGEKFENVPGYITFVLVEKGFRRQGIGTLLLNHVEQYLKSNGKKSAQIIFFNPINLRWNIPGTNGHDHPNAPGVDMSGIGFLFFVNRGYWLTSVENAMHLDLSHFEIGPKDSEKIAGLRNVGFSIEYYDRSKHDGFDQLFDGLKNEYWRKEIRDNLALKEPKPILVANHSGKICGFAGPIAVEESGRGWFAGIGVDPACEGKGLGSMLFVLLMKTFKDLGARFSTLFTGVDNPAGKIYKRTGFQVVKQWAVMRKDRL